jgi:putative component of membrane protein insertase Oxa1/YidC/SpoIIIJ protein YidD
MRKVVIIFSSVFAMVLAHGQTLMKAPTHHIKQSQTKTNNVVLDFYQKYISPIDGDRCQMRPSCSQYAKQAFSKYGPHLGFLLTTDRLTRCGMDLYYYPLVTIKGKQFAIDSLR